MLNDKCRIKVFPSEMILNFVLIGITQQSSKLQFGGLFDRERVGRGLAPPRGKCRIYRFVSANS